MNPDYFSLAAISEETYMDKALTRLHSSREHEHEKEADGDEILGPINDSTDIGMEPSSNLLVTSTVSVPEVSLVPSPEVSKVGESINFALYSFYHMTSRMEVK